jgi:proline racemase
MGLEDLDAMSTQILVDRIRRILEIRKLTRARRAVLATRGSQSFGDAVVTERALLGSFLGRVDEATTVGARLHAVTATETVLLIDEHDAFR